MTNGVSLRRSAEGPRVSSSWGQNLDGEGNLLLPYANLGEPVLLGSFY